MRHSPPRAAARALAALALLAATSSASRAAERVSDLLGWLPARTNLALFVDADKLRKSDLGKKNKWATGKEITAGVKTLPPGITHLIVAAEVAPGVGVNWEVFVAGLKKAASDDDLLAGTGGKKDRLAERNVVLTPRHGFAVNLAPGVTGSYQPANRQEASRWLRSATGKVPAGLSPYVKQAAATVSADAPIVLALDTTDMFDPTVVQGKLKASALFKGKDALVEPVAKLFGGMRGMTVTFRVTDKIECEMQFDFGQDAGPLKTVAAPMILAVFERMGVRVDEMDNWKANVQGQTVTFGGAVTEESVREMLSPFLRPSVSSLDVTESQSTSEPTEGAKAQASLKYFKAAQEQMTIMRKSSATSYEKLGTNFNTAARHIDELPILNVDEELLNWGGSVATTFRSMSIAARKAGGLLTVTEANQATVSVSSPNYYTGSYGGYAGGYYGGYGWGGSYAIPSGSTSTTTYSNLGQISNIMAMTKGAEADYRRNTWKNIDSATTDVRRKMVKKYNIEF